MFGYVFITGIVYAKREKGLKQFEQILDQFAGGQRRILKQKDYYGRTFVVIFNQPIRSIFAHHIDHWMNYLEPSLVSAWYVDQTLKFNRQIAAIYAIL